MSFMPSRGRAMYPSTWNWPYSSKISTQEEEPVMLPESSIMDVSTRLVSGQKLVIGVEYDTSALPGGKKVPMSFPSPSISWRDAVGIAFPSKQTLDYLVDAFFSAVDWFMMVFHEEDFRQRYEELMTSTHVSSLEDNNNLWITLLVLGLGAHYSSLGRREPHGRSHMQQLSKDILGRVEQQFLRIISSADEEAVQICVLLGSFYLFNGRPTAGLGILGSGIKIAQVLRLHREGTILGISPARLESRRRSWLALEVFDKYAAIAFGRPCSIDDSDCDVTTVSEIKTNKEEPHRQAVRLDYHRWKFRLYRIVGRFLGRRLQTNRLESVQSIHAQLISWQTQLPENLRLERYKDKSTQDTPSLLQMQALALQLTYDNIQIILHRSLAFGSGSRVSNADRLPDDLPKSALSRKQLFQSALRTSELNDYSHVLHACGKTHAAMHVGICLFTAGVVLCAFAISEPLSATSEAAKNGVMNILRFQHDPILNQHLLSAQSVKILEDLVTVLLRSEHSFIRGDTTITPPSVAQTKGEEETRIVEQSTNVRESRESESSRLGDANSTILPEGFSNFQEPSMPDPNKIGDGSFDGTSFSMGPELDLLSMDSAAGLTWTGGNPYFIDPSFADASQLWLWSSNPDVQPFLD
ncbi:putative Zn(II)2Cys6 transcription factor [Penicillium brasilianum]|uniref:Putative Zn(II)2Cys6 transcription factor n=1 Tax=Penicillium brasilianum TaxID=104259 RepID=A0A1S9RMJ5_PENBI|nr:putative Zn(II)2Cys6 transcription factor [Penicillium brasilianum]